MGSDYKKPDATTVITQENYKNILWPLDIRDLFFVGKATADKLQGIGIHTIGQLAESDRHTVTALLGTQGSIIHDYANGLDQTPVSRFDEKRRCQVHRKRLHIPSQSGGDPGYPYSCHCSF